MTMNNLIIPQSTVQETCTVAMALLSMADCYDLPEPVRLMIEELNDRTDTLGSISWVNKSGGLRIVSN